MQAQPYQALAGSARTPVPGASRVADAPAEDHVDVTVVLHRRRPLARDDEGPTSAPARAEVEQLIGADPAGIEAVERFAHDHGLTVTAVHPAARSVGLSGTVAQMNQAFRVDLGEYHDGAGSYRGREGEIFLPAGLTPYVQAVLGLDDRPQARAYFRPVWTTSPTLPGQPATPGALRPHATTPQSYPPQEVARRYAFPADADGTGQTVAVIELGGGYRPADLAAYFTAQGLRHPKITAVSVDGARNTPGGDADGEVALDVEVIGAIAPGAHQAVYFAPNTTRGFYDAIAAAVHDTRRSPSVISISWGGPENSWTAQALDSYDGLFADAALLGVSVFCASGDDGSSDKVSDGAPHVDFPAASPHVLGCGGTTLTDAAETVWNQTSSGHGATGGGVSRHFPLPAYQARAGVPASPEHKPGRGVPDVAGDADPLTGYQVRVGTKNGVIGGTSAVAPLWAALTALLNQKTGRRLGAGHEFLYGPAAAGGGLKDIVEGNNGAYAAGVGWDACTGLGRPIGLRLLELLTAS